GAAPPAEIGVWPAGRADAARLVRARGGEAVEALQAAWPAALRRSPEPTAAEYRRWTLRNEPDAAELGRIKAWTASLNPPLISVLMPVHDPEPAHLAAAIASVRAQTNPGWELILADDGSRSGKVARLLDEAAASDNRIRLVRLGMSRGPSIATNAALELATGEACLFLDHDDLLAPHALALIAAEFAQHPNAAAVYTDEDTADAQGRRSAPLFKPDFDAERLLSQNYVNHAFAVRTDLLRKLGGLRDGVEGAQDHDLVLRVLAAGEGGIHHLPHVLYHWRVYPGGRTFSQRRRTDMAQARLKAVRDHLVETGAGANAEPGPRGYLRIRRASPTPEPRVRVIVPTRDRPGLLAACAHGVLERTTYANLELCIVDNGSVEPEALTLLETLAAQPNVRVLRIDAPFNFSALNNAAAKGSDADLLVFVNDDVLAAQPDWLGVMAAEAVRPEIGAVGAALVYPDGRWQHGGVVTGLGPQGVAGHELRGRPGDEPGPQGRLLVQREVSAVTAACMAVSRAKFEAVGGFDESLAVAFNDVDLCLKLRAAGYRNLWTPHARLIHAESATRGSDQSPERAAAFAAEAAAMKAKWGEALVRDPFYNPNLTLEDESFSLAADSRVARPWL
ncbi:MAG: glycosyltransferase family 2 protein, partial [Caulobacteraceae bacterium]